MATNKFKVIGQVMSSGRRVGFQVASGDKQGSILDTAIDDQALRQIINLTKDDDGFHLRDGEIQNLPQYEIFDVLGNLTPAVEDRSFMAYTGRDLEVYAAAHAPLGYAQRDIVDSICQYYQHPMPGRILGIYGLRGTGKTVALLQAARILDPKLQNTVYILVDQGSQMTPASLYANIQDLCRDKKLVIIDEATYINNLVENGDTLYNKFYGTGTMLVLSGTDSLAMLSAQYSSLYHRIFCINSTFISYAEAKRTVGFGLMEYLAMGGLYKADRLDTIDALYAYISTSLFDNIFNTIQKNKASTELTIDKLRHIPNADIRVILMQIFYSIIYQGILESESTVLETTEINFSTVMNLFTMDPSQAPSIIHTINEEICRRLQTNSISIVTPAQISTILQFLLSLGIIVEAKNLDALSRVSKFYITNPSIVNQLYYSVYTMMETDGYERNTRNLKTLQGNLLESAVLTHLWDFSQRHGLSLAYFRNRQGREIDAIVYFKVDDWDSSFSIYYEIKLTDVSDIAVIHTKWLNDTEYASGERPILADSSKILKKYILYRGASKVFQGFETDVVATGRETVQEIEQKNMGVELIHVEDFLLHLEEYLKDLVDYASKH